jgi:uncharacterized protein YfaS (alpha-2-macroglobulin family)
VTVKRHEDDAPVAGRAVTLVVGEEVWRDKESTFVPRQTLNGVTDAKGIASFPVKVTTEGSLVLKSTVKDNAGRPVMSIDYVYVEGDRFYGPPDQTFTVTVDKKTYNIGDRAKILIKTNKPGCTALVTIEAEHLMAHYLVELKKAATTVTIPVTRDYAPNVWVSAVAISNKHLLEATEKLSVNLTEHELKVKVVPDKPDYLPGDTANLTVQTTDSDNRPVAADVSIGVVDESIYAIKADTTNIKRAFYPMRENSVRTNYSFEEIYLDGGDKAGGNIPVRTKFLDTAEWTPDVYTNEKGIGHTSVKLPDNLTSWRATAVGVSDATQVGITRVNFRARKPLAVRLELPSFLVQQDTQKITAIITNDTGADKEVTVRLDAQGITVAGELASKVVVPAARPQSITWDVQTPNSGNAQLTVYATTDGFNDAEGRTLNVEAHGRQLVENHSGEVRDSLGVDFTVSDHADKNTGRLMLTLSPSVASSIYQSLDNLIDFPYGCTEQTMSRFLPAALLASTLKKMNLRSDLQAKIPDIVQTGFARLGRMQHSNGAWGWWEYDAEDPFMTAYVLDGLKRAKDAGYSTDKVDIPKALEWTKKHLKDGVIPKYGVRDFLYLCYAAARYGAKAEAKAALTRVTPAGASEYALLALIDDALGDTAARGAAMASMRGQISVEGDIARVKPLEWEYGSESVDLPLMALTTLAPTDSTAPKLVAYLLASRRGDMWYSTRDSSFALVALIQYMNLSKDMGQPLDIDVSLNGAPAKHIHFDPANPFNPDLRMRIPISDLKPGPNHVDFKRTAGSGNFYYSGELRQVELADRLLPLSGSGGLDIKRDYYLLLPQRMESGDLELRPTRRSIDEAKTGDLVRVVLTVTSDRDREFIMVEDPIPSGCRIMEREYLDAGEEWTYWWSQTIVRDDKAAFFMRYVKPGTWRLTYTMRAEQVGLGHAMPPTISNMYDPAQTASSGETLLRVTQ